MYKTLVTALLAVAVLIGGYYAFAAYRYDVTPPAEEVQEPVTEGPGFMSLHMKTWRWVGAHYNDGRSVTPKGAKPFTLTFEDGNRFTATTDCNSVGGSYASQDGTIAFTEISSTKMYCEGSQESEFITLLRDTSAYHFTDDAKLVFDLKFDSGSAVFE